MFLVITRESIVGFDNGRNITEKVSNQKMLCFSTSPN